VNDLPNTPQTPDSSPQVLQPFNLYRNKVSCCGFSHGRLCLFEYGFLFADLGFLEPFDWTTTSHYKRTIDHGQLDIYNVVVDTHRWRDYSRRLYDSQAKQPRIQQLNGRHRRLGFRGSLPRSNAKQRNVCNIPYSDMSHVQRLTLHEQSDLMERHSLCRAPRWKPSLYATRAIVIAVFSCRRHDY
jgi:hypothetical protein